MYKAILLLITMGISYSQSKIMSSDILAGLVFPLLFLFSLLLLLIWLIRKFHKNRKHDSNTDDGGNAYFLNGKNNDGDSGDGGGGD